MVAYRSSQPVTGDTHLFGEGEIGRASEGFVCRLVFDIDYTRKEL